MAEIIPGVHQFKIPIPNNPLGNTNVYLLQGNDENLLIDTGWNSEEAFQSLEKQLTETGIKFSDISHIVITHAHRDHYGLAGRLKQVTGATISLHQRELDLLTSRFQNTEEFLRQVEQWLQSHGAPADELAVPLPPPARGQQAGTPTFPDHVLSDGETITIGEFNLQVIWTPGHSPGHICLYEPARKILFSGDHVLPVITPNVSLQPQSGNNPLGDFLDSLDRVKKLDTKLVLPAHENTFTDLPGRVKEIIQHHHRRNSEILETLKTRPKTAYRIAKTITWMAELGGVSFRDLEPWDKRMAISETLAHLEAMRTEGMVAISHRNGVIHYQHT